MSCLRRPFLLSYSNHDKSMKEDKVLQVYIPVSIHFTDLKLYCSPKKGRVGSFSPIKQKDQQELPYIFQICIFPEPLSYLLDIGGTLAWTLEISYDTWPYMMSVLGWWLITLELGSVSLKRQAKDFIGFNNVCRNFRPVRQSHHLSSTQPEFEWVSLEERNWGQMLCLS